MSLSLSNLKLVGSAVMADDNTTTAIGGAKATSRKPHFQHLAGLFQIVSSAGADTTQSITVSYRNVVGSLLSEAHLLNGQTAVLFAALMDRVEKALKGATTTGDVALEAQTATRTGTAQSAVGDTITFDAGASAVDGAYVDYIVRITGGLGAGQIRLIRGYVGSTKTASLNHPWTVAPDATSTFRISAGMFFDRQPFEVTEVRRVFYNAAANAPGGGAVNYYDKLFYFNSSNGLALLTATIALLANPSSKVAFGLGTVDGVATNGGGNNRTVAPAGIVFATTATAVPGTDLHAGSSVEVWLRLALGDGEPAINSSVDLSLSGLSAA